MVEMNITTMTSPWPGEIETCAPCKSARAKSALLAPTRNSWPNATAPNNVIRVNGIRILFCGFLGGFDFQIHHRLLAGIEGSQGSHGARSSPVVGFERIVHVRIEAVELIGALFLRDEG